MKKRYAMRCMWSWREFRIRVERCESILYCLFKCEKVNEKSVACGLRQNVATVVPGRSVSWQSHSSSSMVILRMLVCRVSPCVFLRERRKKSCKCGSSNNNRKLLLQYHRRSLALPRWHNFLLLRRVLRWCLRRGRFCYNSTRFLLQCLWRGL
jgi:hypothetical protein